MPTDEAAPTVRLRFRGLGPGRTRLFPFERDGERLTGILVDASGEPRAYVNRCPHVTYSLDMGDGDVMDATRKFLLCHSHGAMFLPESGECFWGPVVGKSLEPLPCRLDGDDVIVTITPEPPDWP
ncbi:MAG: Rieske 2Fe-2S domain-containing protein [Deltaproteobacteria bacterium]|nr:Rieske 2Fe-2S domain-containing protein [Deltaproteobacteria bacterium]MCB9786409.1 Rieske 2Fe-2S domain-containing protein [Deltaproteobacteria bacterium]